MISENKAFNSSTGWCRCQFIDVVDSFKRGPFGSAIKKEYFVPKGYKVYQQQNAIYNDPNLGHYFIDKDKYEELSAFSVESGDFIVSCSGTIGRISYLKSGIQSGIINQALLRIRLNKEIICNEFFLFLFRSAAFQRQVLIETKGSAMLNIAGVKELKVISIDLPPLNEQRRIVAKIEELFSEIDKGVESLKTAKVQLQVYRQALLKHAFEGKLTAQWRADNQGKVVPAAELLRSIDQAREERYQQQLTDWQTAIEKWEFNGKEGKKPSKPSKPIIQKSSELSSQDNFERYQLLPKNWTWAKIRDVAAVGTGGTPLKSRTDFYRDGTIFWVTSGALNNEFVRVPSGLITQAALNENNLKLYPSHTLLVALYGEGKTRGKCSELLIEAATNQAIAAIVQSGLEEKIRPYLKLFFQMNYDNIRRKSSGGVQPNLNLGIIENTAFPLCSLEEQSEIVNLLQSKLSIISSLQDELESQFMKAEALRQSILKKAFSGQLVPQDSNDEPASELLKRIKAEKVDQETTKKQKVRSSK